MDRGKKWIGKLMLAAGALLVLACTLICTPVTSEAATGDWAGAKKAIVAAYQSYKTEVDVSAYNLNYKTEYSELSQTMGDIVNRTPYLFYAGTSYTVSRKSTTNQIVKIGLGYASDYKKTDGTVRKKKIRNTRTKLDTAINTAMKSVSSNMTKIEKAMILHDYVVSHTAYTESSSKQYRLTEIGVFLYGQANCQGYSLAYGILLERAGIPVDYVSSESMSHMWNIMKIGGKWYNVDTTWDDPIDTYASKDQYGLVKHNNFMCSDEKFKLNGHSGFDTNVCTSTKYDAKYWKSVNSAFSYHDGKWLYQTKSALIERAGLTKAAKKTLYNISSQSLVQYSDTLYYLIAYNSIYLYDYSDNSATALWKTSSVYSSSYNLAQLKYKKSYLYYRVLSGKTYKTAKLKVNSKGKLA